MVIAVTGTIGKLIDGYPLLDWAIMAGIILSVLIIGIRFFSGSKKRSSQSTPVPLSAANKEEVGSFLSPQITVVFQKDISNDEELSREIADMYISNRAYYYAGKTPSTVLPEETDPVIVKYDNVDFSILRKIDI